MLAAVPIDDDTYAVTLMIVDAYLGTVDSSLN